jgi:NTE family protein
MSDCKIGLALGGGSARGWAHIGVLRALHEAGIYPDIVDRRRGRRLLRGRRT